VTSKGIKQADQSFHLLPRIYFRAAIDIETPPMASAGLVKNRFLVLEHRAEMPALSRIVTEEKFPLV